MAESMRGAQIEQPMQSVEGTAGREITLHERVTIARHAAQALHAALVSIENILQARELRETAADLSDRARDLERRG